MSRLSCAASSYNRAFNIICSTQPRETASLRASFLPQQSAGLCTSARSDGDASPTQDVVARLAEALKQDAQPKTTRASRTETARGRSKACRGLSRGDPQKGSGQGEGRGGPARGRSEDDASADRRRFRERRAASTTTSAARGPRRGTPRSSVRIDATNVRKNWYGTRETRSRRRLKWWKTSRLP